MREWFELGTKIGCIELTAKLCNLADMLISSHDIEDVHYEILDYMRGMGLDDSKIASAKIEDYEDIVLNLITSPMESTKRQLFLLGFYMAKLKILLANGLDDMFNEQRQELHKYMTEIIETLELSKSLKKISLENYREKDFEDIEIAIKNNVKFDTSNDSSQSKGKNKEFRIEMIVLIIVALIGAVATIIAAIISRT